MRPVILKNLSDLEELKIIQEDVYTSDMRDFIRFVTRLRKKVLTPLGITEPDGVFGTEHEKIVDNYLELINQYLKSNPTFELLGDGSSRDVYQTKKGEVVKICWNREGQQGIQKEAELFNKDKLGVFPKVEETCPLFTWMIVEKVNILTLDSDQREFVSNLFPKLSSMFDDVEMPWYILSEVEDCEGIDLSCLRNSQSKDISDNADQIYKYLQDMDVNFKKILYASARYNISDYHEWNYGWDDDWNVKIIDAGWKGNHKNIISENDLNEGRVEDAKEKFPNIDQEAFQLLLQNDPSGNNKYLMWMAKQVDAGQNVKRVLHYVNIFNKNQKKLDRKSIEQYEDLADLAGEFISYQDDIESLEGEEVEADNVIHEDERFKIFFAKSFEEMKQLGHDTNWCVAQKNGGVLWTKYAKDGLVFSVVFDKKLIESEPYNIERKFTVPVVGGKIYGREVQNTKQEPRSLGEGFVVDKLGEEVTQKVIEFLINNEVKVQQEGSAASEKIIDLLRNRSGEFDETFFKEMVRILIREANQLYPQDSKKYKQYVLENCIMIIEKATNYCQQLVYGYEANRKKALSDFDTKVKVTTLDTKTGERTQKDSTYGEQALNKIQELLERLYGTINSLFNVFGESICNQSSDFKKIILSLTRHTSNITNVGAKYSIPNINIEQLNVSKNIILETTFIGETILSYQLENLSKVLGNGKISPRYIRGTTIGAVFLLIEKYPDNTIFYLQNLNDDPESFQASTGKFYYKNENIKVILENSKFVNYPKYIQDKFFPSSFTKSAWDRSVNIFEEDMDYNIRRIQDEVYNLSDYDLSENSDEGFFILGDIEEIIQKHEAYIQIVKDNGFYTDEFQISFYRKEREFFDLAWAVISELTKVGWPENDEKFKNYHRLENNFQQRKKSAQEIIRKLKQNKET